MEKKHLFNRELSWLSFNHRVLQEAKDPSVPLYERIKFIAIFSSNLDEFFRVRVAFLRSLLALKRKNQKDLDFDPEKILKKIHITVNRLQEEYGRIMREEIIPELNRNNIFLSAHAELSHAQKEHVSEYFNREILPLVNPMILVRKKVMPFLKNSSLYLAVKLQPRSKEKETASKRFRYAIVEIPSDRLPRFMMLPSLNGDTKVIFLDDIIRFSLPSIFPGYGIVDSYSIKLTRDAELYIDDEYSGDLLDKIKKSLSRRNTGIPCRFLYDKDMPKDFLLFLKSSLMLSKEDIIPGGKYHNYSDFFSFPKNGHEGLEYEKLRPLNNPSLDTAEDIFPLWGNKEILLHFPYQSYEYVLNAFNKAADDPQVKSIKVTQYRFARDSEIVRALIRALKNGKTVTVFAEVKARFDEESNIRYAKELENAGAKVLYSLPGLKVHAKIALIKRAETDGDRLYAFVSTGNFNEKTAGIYEDYGLFTSDERITKELKAVFYYLEGKEKEPAFSNILVGQFNMRSSFAALIENEIKLAKKGKEAAITIKLNSLEDPKMIEKLYEASAAGVKINIIVRGICCIIPGVKKLSENIKVISIVDRYLEHSRVYSFNNGGEKLVYLSSADWMKRNLSRRIEIAFPVYNERNKESILKALDIMLNDNIKARVIDGKQSNKYKKPAGPEKIRSQWNIYEELAKEYGVYGES